MTDREKIIEALKGNIDWTCVLYKYKDVLYENNVERIADALIAAGIRDITREGYICMNGEVIVPTPDIYNKVAELLSCPKIKEREIEEEKRK